MYELVQGNKRFLKLCTATFMQFHLLPFNVTTSRQYFTLSSVWLAGTHDAATSINSQGDSGDERCII